MQVGLQKPRLIGRVLPILSGSRDLIRYQSERLQVSIQRRFSQRNQLLDLAPIMNSQRLEDGGEGSFVKHERNGLRRPTVNHVIRKYHVLSQFVEQGLYEDEFATAKPPVCLVNGRYPFTNRAIDLLRIKLEGQVLGVLDNVFDNAGRIMED
jgi:hypothetical protein